MNRNDQQQPRHRRVRSEERAYSTENSIAQRSACSRSARSAAAPSCARGCSSPGPTPTSRSAVEAPTIRVIDAFTSGGAQVAGGQHARGRQLRLRSRLRARQPHVPHRHRSSTAAAWRSDDTVELSRHLHVREPRGVRRGPAAQLHAPHRRSEHPLQQLCRARSTCRTTSACAAT